MDTVATNARQRHPDTATQTLPYRFWIGITLVACWWAIAWLQWRPFSDHYFFPLWLGYILTIDSVVYRRTGSSLIERARWRIVLLFILSAPVWWLFEGINLRLNNWIYHLPEQYGDVSYAVRSSIAFSTVIPAVLITSELVRSMRLTPLRKVPALSLQTATLLLLHLGGWAMLAAVLVVPRYAFPLAWISVFFIVDPIATWLGGRSIGSYLRQGDWSPVFNVALGTLICGLFWEFWNVFSMPKWTYDIPFAGWLHVFEMPLPGYGGYIPFGLEIVAMYALASAMVPRLNWPEARISSLEPN